LCGKRRNHEAHHWVLLETLNPPAAYSLLHQANPRSPSPDWKPKENVVTAEVVHTPDGFSLLAWLIQVALADSVIDEREHKALLRVARVHHIPESRMQIMIEAVQQGQLNIPEPENDREAKIWLETAIDVAVLNGRVPRAELELLTRVGQQLGLSDIDVKKWIKQRWAELRKRAPTKRSSSSLNSPEDRNV